MTIMFDEFHMAFYAAALLVSLTIVMQTLIQRRTDRVHNLAFIVMTVIILINSITESVSEFIRPYLTVSDSYMLLDDAMQLLYFIFHSLLSPIFLFYEVCLTGAVKKRTDAQAMIFFVPIVIMEMPLMVPLSEEPVKIFYIL